MSKLPKLFTSRYAVAAAVALAIGGGAVFMLMRSMPAVAAPTKVGADSGRAMTESGKVAAVVNGKDIFNSELYAVMGQGVDRANAIDRHINKALAADLARSEYADAAKEALLGAEREVLSQLYVAKKTQDLRSAVTDADVKAFFDTSVRAEDYAQYKVRFLVSADEQGANEVAAAIAEGKGKDVESRFKPVKEGENFVMAAELPYGLGNVVRSLKPGEFSRPIVLRNGYFLLRLDETKAGEKPELAKVADEIKNVLVAKKLSETLVAARSAAKVELR